MADYGDLTVAESGVVAGVIARLMAGIAEHRALGSGPCCDGTYLGQQIEPNHGQDETVRYRLEDLKSRQGDRAAAIEPTHV